MNKVKDRNPRKRWFITFPQCGDIGKKQFAELLANEFACAKYICVEEKHADGNPHLHLLVELNGSVPKSNLLKWAERAYPNDYKRLDFEGVRAWNAARDYITKPGTYGAKGKEKAKDGIDPEPLLFGMELGKKQVREKGKYCDIMYCGKCKFCITELEEGTPLLDWEIRMKQEGHPIW